MQNGDVLASDASVVLGASEVVRSRRRGLRLLRNAAETVIVHEPW